MPESRTVIVQLNPRARCSIWRRRPRRRGHRQRNFALFGELDCVAEQIDEHLAQPVAVADQIARRVGGNVEHEFQRFVTRRRRHEAQRRLEHCHQVKRRPFQFQPVRLDLREIENVVDDDAQAVAAGARGLHKVTLFGGQRGVEQEAGHAQDGVERGANLVAHVGEKLALGPRRGFRRFFRLAQRLLGAPLHRHILHDRHDARRVVDLHQFRVDQQVDFPAFGRVDGQRKVAHRSGRPQLRQEIGAATRGNQAKLDHGAPHKLPARSAEQRRARSIGLQDAAILERADKAGCRRVMEHAREALFRLPQMEFGLFTLADVHKRRDQRRSFFHQDLLHRQIGPEHPSRRRAQLNFDLVDAAFPLQFHQDPFAIVAVGVEIQGAVAPVARNAHLVGGLLVEIDDFRPAGEGDYHRERRIVQQTAETLLTAHQGQFHLPAFGDVAQHQRGADHTSGAGGQHSRTQIQDLRHGAFRCDDALDGRVVAQPIRQRGGQVEQVGNRLTVHGLRRWDHPLRRAVQVAHAQVGVQHEQAVTDLIEQDAARHRHQVEQSQARQRKEEQHTRHGKGDRRPVDAGQRVEVGQIDEVGDPGHQRCADQQEAIAAIVLGMT
jgi:hypothetical protein